MFDIQNNGSINHWNMLHIGSSPVETMTTFQIMATSIGLTYTVLFLITIVVCSLPRCIKVKGKETPETINMETMESKTDEDKEMVPLQQELEPAKVEEITAENV